MIYTLYDIILHISVIVLLPYFVVKMLSEGKYRTGTPERFAIYKEEKLRALEGGDVVWFHAVSVGETKAVLPLLKLFKERHPEKRVVFSTVTPTANRVAKNEEPMLIDALIYFPLDLSWVVKRAVERLKPSLFIVVEKEVWPNVIHTLHQRGVPIVVVNGTVSERSFGRYKKLGFFFGDIFSSITRFCARTEEDRERAISLGVPPERAIVTGNLKFDIEEVKLKDTDAKTMREELGIGEEDPVIVAGSTHAGEEEILLDVFKRLKEHFPDLKLILAPRHPERFDEVETLLRASGVRFKRRTDSERLREKADVVLLDTIGELTLLYSLSTVAFVGGSLVEDVGGHNLLEPAVFSKPVIYGAHLKSYLYMAELLEKEGGGMRVEDKEALFSALCSLLADRDRCHSMGIAARRVVDKNRGATKKTLDIIEELLQTHSPQRNT